MNRIAISLNDEVTKAGVRHEVGTLAADGNPLDERMRAMAASIGYLTPEKTLETREHAEAGLKADPENARLLGLLAYYLATDVIEKWNGVDKSELARAEALANKAIFLDHNTVLAHQALGWINRLQGNHKAALDAFKETIKIDPNFARGYSQVAQEMIFLGDAKGALLRIEKAIQLSRKDPWSGAFFWVQGRAYFTLKDYANASEALGESVRERPNVWYARAWLVAASALNNDLVKAGQALTEFKKTFPQYDLNWITKYYQDAQFNEPTLQAAVAELLKGLQQAGLK
jgi:tetratricopeptide (TPR) repeat protein